MGYEIIDSQPGRVGYNHLISNKRVWNAYFSKKKKKKKKNREILARYFSDME